MAKKIHSRLYGLILLIILVANAGCAYFHWHDEPSAEAARLEYLNQTNNFVFEPGTGFSLP